MNSPDYESINEERQKLGRTCGAELRTPLPTFSSNILSSHSCGAQFEQNPTFQGRPSKIEKKVHSERKHITALFADVSGYTSLAEFMDPEDLKDIISFLVAEMNKVVDKYQGSMENFAGDQIMVLFGYPQIHEDDSVRAVKTAIEIHRVAEEISQKFQETLKHSLAVHIGINSGLAVTGQADFHNTTNHIAGDAINVASRLCSLAKAGETLVGQNTYAQTAGFFFFETLETVQVKGKTKPVQVYRLIRPKELP